MDNDLISKIISGQASEKEKKAYFNLISEDREKRELFLKTKELWVKSNADKKLPQSFINNEFNAFWQEATIRDYKIKRSKFLRIFRYAAVAILFWGIGGILSYLILNSDQPDNNPIQHFAAEKGSLAHFEFSDGTKVWLNSATELLFSENDDGAWEIELKGEAYFDVENSAVNGLIINAGELKIKDIGTSFNVRAYPDEEFIETTLLEGRVDILKPNNQMITSLKPGENARYTKDDNSLNIKNVDVALVSAWVDGKFAFRDARLEDICRELENWYDVEFLFKNEALKDFRYSGAIDRANTVAYVLKMLKVTTNIHYEIVEKQYKPCEIIIF